ncbi:MAG TPA: peptidylprolyl isomerase [Alphaproteobacteria bacterium]|jgi:peptidyl-prolyl cis-trans isomerase C
MFHGFRAAFAGASLIALSAVLAISAPATVQAQTPAKPAAAPANSKAGDDPVVARVDGQPILRSEVLAAVDGLPPQYRAMPVEAIYPALLGQLIDRKLVVAQAKKDKLENDAAYKERVAELQGRVLEQYYFNKKIDAQLTDAVLKKEYDKMPSETKVRASHILVKTRDEAVQIIRDIDKGAKFEDVAAKKSIDPSGKQGGDLGYFTKDQMVAPFSDAAFKLKKGEMTKSPVETQFGWHIIRVDDIQKDSKPSFEESREELRDKMSDEVFNAEIEKLRASAKVERFSMDGSPLPPQAMPDNSPKAMDDGPKAMP